MRIRVIATLFLVGALSVGCGQSSSPSAPTPVATPAPMPMPAASTNEMLQALNAYINSALAENQALLPRNPQSTAQIQAKITMLQSPTLASGSRCAQSTGSSPAISVVFPLKSMRVEAQQAVSVFETALRYLAEFLGTPFPAPSVKLVRLRHRQLQ